MAKVALPSNGAHEIVKRFIERNRAQLEHYIAADPSIIIHADGLVTINVVMYVDAKVLPELLKGE